MASTNQSPEKQAISSLIRRQSQDGLPFEQAGINFVQRDILGENGFKAVKSEIHFHGRNSAIRPYAGGIAMYAEAPLGREYNGMGGSMPTRGVLVRPLSESLGDNFEAAKELCSKMGLRPSHVRVAELMLRAEDAPVDTDTLVSADSELFVPEGVARPVERPLEAFGFRLAQSA